MIPIGLIISKLMGMGNNAPTMVNRSRVVDIEPDDDDNVSMNRTKPWKNTNVPQLSDSQPSNKTGVEYYDDDGTGRLSGG